jgi:MFS family permease
MSYTALLRQHAAFRRLFTAYSVSVLGDWFNTIAMLGLVYAVTSSGLMVSLTLIARALPTLLLSPFVGVLVDRADRKKILILSDLANAFLALGLLFAEDHFWVIFVVNVLMSIASAFFAPARQAVLPSLLPKEQLASANALFSTVWGVMSVIGASLGGVVAEATSSNTAFVLNSVTFLISAFFVFRASLPAVADTGKRLSFFADMRDGYRFIGRTPVILALVLVGASWGVVGGAYSVLLTVYGTDVFHAGKNGIGILYTAQGVGVILGGLLVKRFVVGSERRMQTFFGWSYLLQGVCFVLFALSSHLVAGVIFLLGMRIAGGVIIPLDNTLIQTYTPESMLGKVFSLHSSVYVSIMQLSMFLTGLLLEKFSPHTVGVAFGLICCLVSVTWLVMLYTNRLHLHPTRT